MSSKPLRIKGVHGSRGPVTTDGCRAIIVRDGTSMLCGKTKKRGWNYCEDCIAVMTEVVRNSEGTAYGMLLSGKTLKNYLHVLENPQVMSIENKLALLETFLRDAMEPMREGMDKLTLKEFGSYVNKLEASFKRHVGFLPEDAQFQLEELRAQIEKAKRFKVARRDVRSIADQMARLEETKTRIEEKSRRMLHREEALGIIGSAATIMLELLDWLLENAYIDERIYEKCRLRIGRRFTRLIVRGSEKDSVSEDEG